MIISSVREELKWRLVWKLCFTRLWLELDKNILEVLASHCTPRKQIREQCQIPESRERSLSSKWLLSGSEQAEWWRWCRFLVLLTFVQKYKTAGWGGPQTVQRPNRSLDCDPVYERFSQETNADVIMEQTEDGNQHRLVVWIENSPLSVTCLPPLCDACGFFVTYNASSSVQPGHEWWFLSAE